MSGLIATVKRDWPIFRSTIVAALFLLLAARLVLFCWVNSVNVLFSDQWHIYGSVIGPHSFWQQFSWQHGPHRQGLWIVLFHLVMEPARWSNRAEIMAMAVIQIISCLGAFWLKKRLRIPWSLSDCALPCFFLTLNAGDTYVMVPNAAHSVLPIFLLTCVCLAWTIEAVVPRLVLVALLELPLLFTGFGILAGALVLALLAWETLVLARRRSPLWRSSAGALAVCLIWLVLFFRGYVFGPAKESFDLAHLRPWEYATFIVRMVAHFAVGDLGLPAQLAVGTVWLAALMSCAASLCREPRVPGLRAQTLGLLAGYSVLFWAMAAYGRFGLGGNAPLAGRYVLDSVPAACALLFYLQLRPAAGRRWLWQVILAAAVIVAEYQRPSPAYLQFTRMVNDRKRAWIASYLATGNAGRATAQAGFFIAPNPQPADLDAKLDYLRRQGLSFFADVGASGKR